MRDGLHNAERPPRAPVQTSTSSNPCHAAATAPLRRAWPNYPSSSCKRKASTLSAAGLACLHVQLHDPQQRRWVLAASMRWSLFVWLLGGCAALQPGAAGADEQAHVQQHGGCKLVQAETLVVRSFQQHCLVIYSNGSARVVQALRKFMAHCKPRPAASVLVRCPTGWIARALIIVVQRCCLAVCEALTARLSFLIRKASVTIAFAELPMGVCARAYAP